MFKDELFSKSGGEFPFRRYLHGTSDNIRRLRYLINDHTPGYDRNGFDRKKIEHKVKSRLTEGRSVFDFFEVGPKNISQNDDWKYNAVIDQYTETARMSSPGYGIKHSPLELWFKTSFNAIRDKILKKSTNLEAAREAIYKEGEVRLAYVTDNIGLLMYVKSLLSDSNPMMIDITAFGDRMVAAAATDFDYIGVDPDPNLVDGLSRLLIDIKTIKPEFNGQHYMLPYEHFGPDREVDFISFSPPPYNAEPYTGGDRQVHKVYRSFEHWFKGFVIEILARAVSWIKLNGILGFSVLDRDSIQYTEAMILAAMSFGFKPLKIFTLSSSAGTPWWLFRFVGEPQTTLFTKLYPDYIVSNIQSSKSVAIEYIRYLASGYLKRICHDVNIFKRPEKVNEIIGRILMSKVTHHNDLDPVYPDNQSEYITDPDEFNDISEFRMPIVLQTSDPGFRISITETDDILELIFSSVIRYLHWIQCTSEFEHFEKMIRVNTFNPRKGSPIVNVYLERGKELQAISFLRKRTLFVQEDLDKIKCLNNKIILWSTSDYKSSSSNVSSFLRYASVGLSGHHFTRADTRVKAIADIIGTNKDNIVDLFATPSNANTKLYTSVYPDVDPGSLGNFMTYEGEAHKYFMANPPPYKGFNKLMIDRLMEVYLIPHPDRVIFYSTTVWEDDGKDYLERIAGGKDPKFDDFENYYVFSHLWKEYKKYVRAVYILHHGTHPTMDKAKGVTYKENRRPSQSVGVILAYPDVKINLDQLELLSKGWHAIF